MASASHRIKIEYVLTHWNGHPSLLLLLSSFSFVFCVWKSSLRLPKYWFPTPPLCCVDMCGLLQLGCHIFLNGPITEQKADSQLPVSFHFSRPCSSFFPSAVFLYIHTLNFRVVAKSKAVSPPILNNSWTTYADDIFSSFSRTSRPKDVLDSMDYGESHKEMQDEAEASPKRIW